MKSLKILNKRIIECRQCPRLVKYREQIAEKKRPQFQDWTYWGKPVPGFGDQGAKLLIIGLAPAAHGGNRTGRVFTGDRSGDWLYEALHHFGFANQPHSTHQDDGLALQNCYVSAVVRCAPPANKPLPKEFVACQPFVVEELRNLTQVRVVIALGKIAFDHYLKACRSYGWASPTPLPRFGHGVMTHLPWGITLLASYHPSQQNTFTGKLTKPMFHKVFRQARHYVDKKRQTSN